MHEILDYLRALSPEERNGFAERCGTSVGYLRKAVSVKQQLGVDLCIRLERESAGALRCESLCPALDWAYLRSTALRESEPNAAPSLTQQGQAATETVAGTA